MITNIKITLLDDAEVMKGDYALFGLEIQLFEAAFTDTNGGSYMCNERQFPLDVVLDCDCSGRDSYFFQ